MAIPYLLSISPLDGLVVPPHMTEIASNTNEDKTALLAVLALEELSPEQRARVAERYELLLEGRLPVASWLASRFSSFRRSASRVLSA